MGMQMDTCLIMEQIGTFFVRVGALEGGFGGGEVTEVKPQDHTCLYFSGASWFRPIVVMSHEVCICVGEKSSHQLCPPTVVMRGKSGHQLWPPTVAMSRAFPNRTWDFHIMYIRVYTLYMAVYTPYFRIYRI
jgi:hypothetical protein